MRFVFVLVGLIAVCYGFIDLARRFAGHDFAAINTTAFGPAILAIDPSLNPLQQNTTMMAPVTPARLSVPSVGIDAAVEAVGQKADGSMATPSGFSTVGWYKLGAKPGEAGNAVIAGHVNNALTKAGVFEHLGEVQLGDVVEVRDETGNTLHYRVRDIEDYPSNTAPLDVIFAKEGPSQLVLITCAGDWDPRARSYDHRLVIFAELQP